MRRFLLAIGLLAPLPLAASPDPRPFRLDDLARIRHVSDPDLAPDGSRALLASTVDRVSLMAA